MTAQQARVSQVISRQKRKPGGLPSDRSNRRQIRLTPLGCQLHTDLLPVYANLRDSLDGARMPARGKTARLRVGMMPFNVAQLHHFWETFQARHAQGELQIRRAPYANPFTRLREDDMDVFVTWLPVDEPDLTRTRPSPRPSATSAPCGSDDARARPPVPAAACPIAGGDFGRTTMRPPVAGPVCYGKLVKERR
ncbi:hypothetical protein [Streptomyces sp. NPDC001205]